MTLYNSCSNPCIAPEQVVLPCLYIVLILVKAKLKCNFICALGFRFALTPFAKYDYLFSRGRVSVALAKAARRMLMQVFAYWTL